MTYFRKLSYGSLWKVGIDKNKIYFAMSEGNVIEIRSIRKNKICRLFILPEYQRKSHESGLMDLLEKEVFENYPMAHIDASFPAEARVKNGMKKAP